MHKYNCKVLNVNYSTVSMTMPYSNRIVSFFRTIHGEKAGTFILYCSVQGTVDWIHRLAYEHTKKITYIHKIHLWMRRPPKRLVKMMRSRWINKYITYVCLQIFMYLHISYKSSEPCLWQWLDSRFPGLNIFIFTQNVNVCHTWIWIEEKYGYFY